MAELAKRSVKLHQDQIGPYIKAYLRFKKLQEFGRHLQERGGPSGLDRSSRPVFFDGKGRSIGISSLRQIKELMHYDATELSAYFKSQLIDLSSVDYEEEQLDEVKRIEQLGLGDFETYVELLFSIRFRIHRQYFLEFLDAVFMKNTESGLMRQGRGRGAKRRYYLGTELLETMILLATARAASDGFESSPILIRDFLSFIQDRYGILIDQPPPEWGLDFNTLKALRENFENLKTRLKDLGYFAELSDAYTTQTIRPRILLR
jgi:hypothetical protein